MKPLKVALLQRDNFSLIYGKIGLVGLLIWIGIHSKKK
jgi:hypothetical protein